MNDEHWMRRALALARKGRGRTSPNPMVGAVLVRRGRMLAGGWHHRAGLPHAEIEALATARRDGIDPRGATLYVTLEPCCTHGRTPPCTDAILEAGIARVVVAATDPNPNHAGRGFEILRAAGIEVVSGVLSEAATELNESFNHWIVHRTPFVTVKAAMTLDGKIATVTGESQWITGEKSRALGMRLRRGVDAILVGVNTVLADDPSLTDRGPGAATRRPLRRIILDSRARTPSKARVVTDEHRDTTLIVVVKGAPTRRVEALRRSVRVLESPAGKDGRVDLKWLLASLGAESVTSLLVEGGGEVNGSFVESGLVHRLALFYAPKIVGGAAAPRGVAGGGVGLGAGRGAGRGAAGLPRLRALQWRRVGDDLFCTSRLGD